MQGQPRHQPPSGMASSPWAANPPFASMQAIEAVTANQDLHTPDLGGDATTEKVTAALIAHIQGRND